jgi:hypothetical protein
MYGHTGEEKPAAEESKRPGTMPKLVMRGGFLGWLAGEWPAGWLSALRLQIVHRVCMPRLYGRNVVLLQRLGFRIEFWGGLYSCDFLVFG